MTPSGYGDELLKSMVTESVRMPSHPLIRQVQVGEFNFFSDNRFEDARFVARLYSAMSE